MHRNKKIAAEISHLPVAPTCSLEGKAYLPHGISQASTWKLHYTCNTTGERAYDSITHGLTKRGYKIFEDFSKPDKDSKSIFYAFSVTSSAFYADYRFNSPGDGQSNSDEQYFDADQRSKLESSKIRDIYMTINER